MSAFLDAISAELVSVGLAGGSTGWPIELNTAGAPDQAVTVYETGGPEPEQASDRRWLRPTFQVVARAKTPALAEAKAGAVLLALDRATVAGFGFFRSSQSTPVNIGPEVTATATRHRFAVNFRGGEA